MFMAGDRVIDERVQLSVAGVHGAVYRMMLRERRSALRDFGQMVAGANPRRHHETRCG
jgi:hypothetical protein